MTNKGATQAGARRISQVRLKKEKKDNLESQYKPDSREPRTASAMRLQVRILLSNSPRVPLPVIISMQIIGMRRKGLLFTAA